MAKLFCFLNKILQESLFPQPIIILILSSHPKNLYTVTRISPKYYSISHDCMKKKVMDQYASLKHWYINTSHTQPETIQFLRALPYSTTRHSLPSLPGMNHGPNPNQVHKENNTSAYYNCILLNTAKEN